MKYNECSEDFKNFVNAHLNKMEKEFDVEYNQNTRDMFIETILNGMRVFKEDSSLTRVKSNKLIETHDNIAKNAMTTLLSKTFTYSKTFENGDTTLELGQIVRTNTKMIKDILSSFDKHMKEIFAAYQKEHNFKDINPVGIGDMNFDSLKSKLGAIGKIKQAKDEYNLNVTPNLNTKMLINESEKSTDKATDIISLYSRYSQELTNATTRNDFKDDEERNNWNERLKAYSQRVSNLKREKEIAENNFACSYNALVEKYYSKNPFKRWFTPSGWALSDAIDSARAKMKSHFGVKKDKDFNNLMINISERESLLFKDIKNSVNKINTNPNNIDFSKSFEDYQENKDVFLNVNDVKSIVSRDIEFIGELDIEEDEKLSDKLDQLFSEKFKNYEFVSTEENDKLRLTDTDELKRHDNNLKKAEKDKKNDLKIIEINEEESELKI